ncbi:hypothetical protein HKD37_17G046483 [Glycine soja]
MLQPDVILGKAEESTCRDEQCTNSFKLSYGAATLASCVVIRDGHGEFIKKLKFGQSFMGCN